MVDLGIWFPQCNPLWDLRILCVMNVIQNWKLLVFLQNWYCCAQNWTRPFLSDAIMFDATSIVILNAPNASKSQWYLYLLLFSKKYFASYLFRVILLLILYLVTTWQNMFVSNGYSLSKYIHTFPYEKDTELDLKSIVFAYIL